MAEMNYLLASLVGTPMLGRASRPAVEPYNPELLKQIVAGGKCSF